MIKTIIKPKIKPIFFLSCLGYNNLFSPCKEHCKDKEICIIESLIKLIGGNNNNKKQALK